MVRKIAAIVCATASIALTSEAARAVTLIHSNDVLGELEPCGCRNNPQGGIARKANLLKRLPEGKNLVQLDAGDFLFPTDTVPALLGAQSELQAARLLAAHELLGHDAIVPGEKDFGLGFAVFERLRKGTKIQFLAANLVKKNGHTFLKPHLLLEKMDQDGKKLRIAVFGLVGESLAWPKELKASPALPAARKQVQVLRKKADLVIALTHQGDEKDRELAEKVAGIDLIIGGHTQSFFQKPLKVGGTLILQSSFRNQYVGVLPLARKLEAEKYQLIGLDAGYDSPAESPSALDEHVKKFKRDIAELNSREEASASSHTGSGGPNFQTFPRCAECHLKQFDFWRKTRHAKAFNSLVENGQNKNKDCLSCHTVGLGARNGIEDINKLFELDGEDLPHEGIHGFLKAMTKADSLNDPVRVKPQDSKIPLRESLQKFTKAWTPVQCENCHAPGGEHPFSGTYSKAVEKTLCLKCHTQDRAPAWYSSSGQLDESILNAKRAQIACPAGSVESE